LYLHSQGLAQLRAGRAEPAVKRFRAAIAAGEDSPRNWIGLALAHSGLGQLDEAGRWYDKAARWMASKESEFSDRNAHPAPPTYITDWLEAQVLRREADTLVGPRRLGDLVLVDRTVPAGQELRLPLGVVELRQDPIRGGVPGSFQVTAPRRTKSPVADGKIGADEYGPPLAIAFTDDKNPGRFFTGVPPKPVTDPKDFGAELFLAYTKTDLFIAVRVRDDKVVISPTESIHLGDSVEVFIDGDRQPNDFDDPANGGKASHEGFQLGADPSGRTYSNGIGAQDYAVAAAPCEGGYVVEFRILLSAIDTDDGLEVTPPGPGATLRFNLVVVDNDEAVQRQERYGILWSDDPSKSPYLQGEGTWLVDLHLARPVKYELVEGPKGAVVDPDSGLLTWKVPDQAPSAKFTLRARDVEQPELTATASFTISTKSGR
jgi:hypothetical protein